MHPIHFPGAKEISKPENVRDDWPGWVKVGEGPEDKWFREGFENSSMVIEPDEELEDGTYELCGPSVNGNKDGFEYHKLIYHGGRTIENAPRTFDELKLWLEGQNIEGIVWHHSDGRMVKIKKKDFGYKW